MHKIRHYTYSLDTSYMHNYQLNKKGSDQLISKTLLPYLSMDSPLQSLPAVTHFVCEKAETCFGHLYLKNIPWSIVTPTKTVKSCFLFNRTYTLQNVPCAEVVFCDR